MAETRSAGTTLVLFAILPALLLAPFLDKPFNIDDTLFVRAARQIRLDPLRPYDFAINWETRSEPMWNVTANPPLTAYVLAAAFSIGGETESAAHAALLPFAMASASLVYWLARRYTARPAAAAALFVVSPAFLVCAGSAMSDVPALAFALAALALAHDDSTRPSIARALLSGLCLGIASVAKYQSIVLIVVVGAIYASQRRSPASWAALLAGFAAPSLAWAALGVATHGSAHLVDTMARGGRGGLDPWPIARRAISAATFAAAALVSPLVIVPAVAARRRAASLALAAGIAAAAVALLLFKLGRPRRPELVYLTEGSTLVIAVCLAIVVLGALMLARSILRRRRAHSSEAGERDLGRGDSSPARLASVELLAIWALVVPAYVVVATYWVAVRYLLPSLCAIAILEVIAIERTFVSERTRRWILTASIAVTAAMGISVSMAENRFARFYKDGALDALALVPHGSRVLFDGHWGFQYYLERAGLGPVEFDVDELRAGDYLLLSEQTRSLDPGEYPGAFSIVKLIEAPPGIPIVTMHRRVNAGFHADLYGLLPFVLSTQSPDRIAVFRVNDRF